MVEHKATNFVVTRKDASDYPSPSGQQNDGKYRN